MNLVWSVPVRGERLGSVRGDLVRARRLIEALRADGHEVFVIEAAASNGGAAATTLYRRVIRRVLPRTAALVLRDVGRMIHARAHARRVADAARARRADLIIETQVHLADSGARATRRSGVPLLLDDCSPVREEVELGAGLPALVRHAFHRQARTAAMVVVSSRELACVLQADGVPPDRIRVVPNGVDAPPLDPQARAQVRARIGAADDECVIVFLGSFQPWHRTELLAHAAARLAPRRRIRVLLAGDGPALAPTLALAERLGVHEHFTALGAVQPADVPALLGACDIGVLPGTNDYGQPMKLLEYAAAGLPAVAPGVAPVLEVLEPERTGLVFPPGDADALAACLAWLAGDAALRREMGAAARARTGEDASWRACARALAAVARSAAATAHTPNGA